MRRAIFQLHLMLGIGCGIFAAVMGVTGCLLAYDSAIDAIINQRLFFVKPAGQTLPLERIVAAANQASPHGEATGIYLPDAADRSTIAEVGNRQIFIDGYTGNIIGSRTHPTLMERVERLHTHLALGKAGGRIVAWIDLAVFVLVLSGVALWWRYRRATIQPKASGVRFWFDLHNTVGIYAAAFLLLLAFTGAILGFESFSSPLINRITRSSPPEWPDAGKLRPVEHPIAIDDAVEKAVRAIPGTRPVYVGLVRGGILRIDLRFPEDRTRAGRSWVFLDSGGDVLQVWSSRTAPLGARVIDWNRAWHTGEIFGWPTKLAALLCSLALAAQGVTGCALWWQRRARSNS